MVLPDRKRLFAFAGVVMVVAVGTGGVMHLQNGILPWTRQCAPDIRFKGLVSNSPDKPILIGDTAKAGSFVVGRFTRRFIGSGFTGIRV